MTAAERFLFDGLGGPIEEEDGSLDDRGGVLVEDIETPLPTLLFFSAVTLLSLISTMSSSSSLTLPEEKRGGEYAFGLICAQMPFGSIVTWSTFFGVCSRISLKYLQEGVSNT